MSSSDSGLVNAGDVTGPAYKGAKNADVFAGYFSHTNDKGVVTYDWKKFDEALKHLPGAELTVNLATRKDVHQNTNDSKKMAATITKYFSDGLGITLSTKNTNAIKEDIEITFDNLNTKEHRWFSVFDAASSKTNFVLTLRKQYIISNNANSATSVLSTMTVKTVTDESGDIVKAFTNSLNDYSVDLVVRVLDVDKDFKAPLIENVAT